METPGEDNWLCVGSIGGAHGIKGWVRVQAFTDSPDNLLQLQGWHLADPQGVGSTADNAGSTERKPVEVIDGRMQGKGLVCRLAGIEDRTAAEDLRGRSIWVRETQLPALEEGEFYWRDLIGLRVYSEGPVEEHEAAAGDSLLLGEVDHLVETGANDVLVLRPCDDSIDKRERLIPYVPGDVIVAVDRVQRAIHVRWHPED